MLNCKTPGCVCSEEQATNCSARKFYEDAMEPDPEDAERADQIVDA